MTNNFWIAQTLVCIKYLVGENYWSPNISMIQQVTPSNKFANIFSAYNFYTTMTGCLGTVMFGYLVNLFNCATNHVVLGRLITVFGTIGFIGSAISWHKAGKCFEEQVKTQR